MALCCFVLQGVTTRGNEEKHKRHNAPPQPEHNIKQGIVIQLLNNGDGHNNKQDNAPIRPLTAAKREQNTHPS